MKMKGPQRGLHKRSLLVLIVVLLSALGLINSVFTPKDAFDALLHASSSLQGGCRLLQPAVPGGCRPPYSRPRCLLSAFPWQLARCTLLAGCRRRAPGAQCSRAAAGAGSGSRAA